MMYWTTYSIVEMVSNIARSLLCYSMIPCSKEQRNLSYGEGIKIKNAIRDFLLSNDDRCTSTSTSAGTSASISLSVSPAVNSI